MPITATNGALTYSRTNLGDPNFTYWMLKGTGSAISLLKGMYVDTANSKIYVQTADASGQPSLLKLNRLVGPEIEYNKIYTASAIGAPITYGFTGYMGYDTTTNRLTIPFRYNRPYTGFPNYIVGAGALLTLNCTDGSVNLAASRWPLSVPPGGNNQAYLNTFESTYDSLGTTYVSIMDVGSVDWYPMVLGYYPSTGFIQTGAATLGNNPLYANSVTTAYGRMITNNANWVMYSYMEYGSTSNTVRWYTNGNPAPAPLYTYNTIYKIQFALTNKRLQAGGIVLDGLQNNMMGVIGNTTDNASYVVKTNIQGSQTLTWQKSISGVRLYNITVDGSDNIYVAGQIVSNGRIYFAKFDTNGNVIFQRQIYGAGALGVPNIYCDANNALYLSFSDGIDPLIVKLPIDGTLTGSYLLGSSTITYATVSQTIAAGTLTTSSPANTGGQPNDLHYGVPGISATGANSSATYNRIPVS